MTVSASPVKTYTAEEYLALEVESELRSEFRDGAIVEMTGGTPEHNEITGMFIFLLRAALRKQPYSIFVTDQRLWIPEANVYTYPDVMVTKRPPELKPGRKDTVMSPILIGETLSDSTQGYDRGEKFAHYRTIETFQEYVLVDQYRPQVEHYVKQAPNQWLFTEYSGLETAFKLASVAVEIALADLYEAVEFNEA
ncbi:MAG: Uma2 family endonuclease [Leptolyngbya sp. SIO4C1]|nr:Uma2 family endonuclease [Leptolyngbya sp. SIO4C1]